MNAVIQHLVSQVSRSLFMTSTRWSSPACQRFISTSIPVRSEETGGSDLGELTPGEKQLTKKIQSAFPEATFIQVADVSGGCGAMYQISIESPKFKGIRTIQQHRMVNQALSEEIKAMHGLQLNTKAPDSN